MSPTVHFSVLDNVNDSNKIFRVTVLTPFLTTAFHLLLYGLYIPLFRSSLRILNKRAPSRSRWFHQISLIGLFILASVGVPLGVTFDALHIAVAYYTSPDTLYRIQIALQMCRYSIQLLMGFTIDSILVFRCLAIFGYPGKKRYVVAGTVLVLYIVIDVCALCFSIWTEAALLTKIGTESFLAFSIQQYISNVLLGINALMNLLLTSTLAGRIWWMSRRNRRLRQAWEKDPASMFSQRLDTLGAILLESGLLYLIGLVVFIVGNLAAGERFDAGSVMIQIGGITPTLLIVRVNAKGRPSEAEEDNFQEQISSRSVHSLSEIFGVEFSESPAMIESHSSNAKIIQPLPFPPRRSS